MSQYTPDDLMWKPMRVGDYWQCATPTGPYNFRADSEADAIAWVQKVKGQWPTDPIPAVTSNELLTAIRWMGDWVRHLDECELNRWYKGNAAPKRCTCGLQEILNSVSALVKRVEQASAHETEPQSAFERRREQLSFYAWSFLCEWDVLHPTATLKDAIQEAYARVPLYEAMRQVADANKSALTEIREICYEDYGPAAVARIADIVKRVTRA